jgi:putative ABC transport system ATP-binding protein
MTEGLPSAGAVAVGPVFEAVGLTSISTRTGAGLRRIFRSWKATSWRSGPSGCGKTTLLQILGALDRPTTGTLRYRGGSMTDLPDPAAYRAHEIGFIFQAFHLLPAFTAAENVQIPMFETDCSRSEREERAFTLLKAVGLEHRLDHFPGKLSGGERQRVAIARSLANNPSILLADEPTGNLDSVNARLVLDLIERLRSERRMTLVLVTHDQTIARRASRVLSMSDGRIASDREAMAIPART